MRDSFPFSFKVLVYCSIFCLVPQVYIEADYGDEQVRDGGVSVWGGVGTAGF